MSRLSDKPLTVLQRTLLNLIVEWRRTGRRLTVRNLAAASGCNATTAVQRRLKALEHRGLIRREPRATNTITVVRPYAVDWFGRVTPLTQVRSLVEVVHADGQAEAGR